MTESLGTKFAQPTKANPVEVMLGASLRLAVADNRQGLTPEIVNDANLIVRLKTDEIRAYTQAVFGAKVASPEPVQTASVKTGLRNTTK